MTFTIQAVRGNGHYFNIRRQHNTIYKADLLHHTGAGWVLEEDVKVTLELTHFIEPRPLKIRGLKSPEAAAEILIGQLEITFAQSLTN